MPRDYKKEYRRYHSRPEQIKRRSKRGTARMRAIRKYGKAALRGKDVHHTDSRTLNPSKIRIISRKKNRGFRRSRTGKNLGLRRK